MKKKIIIGAIALMGVFGGLTAWQSFSGQNDAKANVPPIYLPGHYFMKIGIVDCPNDDRNCVCVIH